LPILACCVEKSLFDACGGGTVVKARLLVESLATDPRAAQRARLLRGIAVLALAILGAIGSATTVWLVARAAIYGWQTSDWTPLEFGGVVPSLFLIFLSLASVAANTPLPRPRRVRPLLDALASGDTQAAPPAATQPKAPSAEALAGPSLRFNRLRALDGPLQTRPLPGLLALSLQTGPLVVYGLTQLLSVTSNSQVSDNALNPVVTVVGPVYVAGCSAVAILLLTKRRHLRVTADDLRITWRRGIFHRARSAYWTAVRSFVRVTYAPSRASANTYTAYLLDTGDAVLAWMETPGAGRDKLDQADALAGVIVSRAHLPLRDLTELVTALSDAHSHPDSLDHFGLLPNVLEELRTLGHKSLLTRAALLSTILLVVLGIAIPLVGVQRLEDYQHSYFASLPQKLHAETPIFYDPLIAFDNQWSTQKPSKDNGNVSLSYRNGTYQMTGQSGCYVYSYPAPAYTDVAVEVTAVQVGTAADGYDGVGLMLRADTDQDMIVFYVSPTNRSWSLAHRLYNPEHPDNSWEDLDDGTSAYVHTGANASNTLLVLVRGQTYLLYVNGHFLDTYSNTYPSDPYLPIAGQAGLYVNDGATTGVFSNFSVYPVQSLPSLSYV
jgi:hypothetical protein